MPRGARFGWARSTLGLYIPLPAGTALAEVITDLVLGYKAYVEKAIFSTAVIGAGAGATRTMRVIKGASTVVATGTVALATTDTPGEQIALTVTDDGGTNYFDDSDTLTVDFPAGGTAFTGGAGNLVLVLRGQPQGLA